MQLYHFFFLCWPRRYPTRTSKTILRHASPKDADKPRCFEKRLSDGSTVPIKTVPTSLIRNSCLYYFWLRFYWGAPTNGNRHTHLSRARRVRVVMWCHPTTLTMPSLHACYRRRNATGHGNKKQLRAFDHHLDDRLRNIHPARCRTTKQNISISSCNHYVCLTILKRMMCKVHSLIINRLSLIAPASFTTRRPT